MQKEKPAFPPTFHSGGQEPQKKVPRTTPHCFGCGTGEPHLIFPACRVPEDDEWYTAVPSTGSGQSFEKARPACLPQSLSGEGFFRPRRIRPGQKVLFRSSGAAGGSRTHMAFRPEDFKSSVYTIPPPRHQLSTTFRHSGRFGEG